MKKTQIRKTAHKNLIAKHLPEQCKMNGPDGEFFRVLTDEDSNSAEIYLYGVIGQDFWWDEELDKESLTDLKVVREFKRLEKKFPRINVRINSVGGDVMHGDAIISAIRNSPAEIHTYVDGVAASMGADIWVNGQVRHMGINSKLMIHSTWTIAVGNARDLRKAADVLDKYDEAAKQTFAAATGMSVDEVNERFYDPDDHWLTANDAKELGLIDEIDNVTAEQEVETEGVSDPENERSAKAEAIVKASDLLQLLQRAAERINETEAQPEQLPETEVPTVEVSPDEAPEEAGTPLYEIETALMAHTPPELL
jgi:ATP-dependent protease ClpP protease subunit